MVREEEDWMCLLFQDGLRMIDIESREWILEQVDFDQDWQYVACSNVYSKKKSTNSQLERTNVSMNLKNLKDYIDWKECKQATHVNKYSKFAKTAGNIQYYKPAQPIVKKSKLSKGVMDFVSSENFGMATMLVCPPLILAHWYAVYQKESIELNSAQYFESEWVFNNREQCLESVAILKSYPKYIQKHINRYSQEELDKVFPKKIISKRIAYDYIRKHGFNIEKVESKTGSTTPTFCIKCGSEILIEFISSFQFCLNLIKLFTFMSVSFISRTMALSVNILYEQLRRVNEETSHNEEPLQSSPDGEAILYHTKLIYSCE
ncbi:predicted protein [Naegleria gruberi]|uniref:Predicted protein n=1 Tax=Naegleria gruberi TaxID=5762 RepID=D2W5A8_NAEGR|nr:uncharacterized protein NAEGRDRAFT_54770 [Naegleria gruberi]EFC35742.1 predicted protein [Naegleria gruberi]|eukprot:XP_002668486.1 predicted protein [Naegleria gruberi strain NEG-M]